MNTATLLIESALRLRKLAHGHRRDARKYQALGKQAWADEHFADAARILSQCRWMLWRARCEKDFQQTIERRRGHVYRDAA